MTDPSAASDPGQLVLPLRRRWLALLMGGGLVLAAVSAGLQLAKDRGFEPPSLQLDRLLNVDEDLSAMNWLTASSFLLAGVAAHAVGHSRPGRRAMWLAAAGVLAFVSLDEAAGVHDPLTVRAEEWARGGGVRAAAVVAVVTVLGVVVVRFLAGLAAPVRWRVAGALGLLLVAAIGIDSAGPDLVADPAARLGAAYVAKATLEEVLELASAVLVLDAMVLAALTR